MQGPWPKGDNDNKRINPYNTRRGFTMKNTRQLHPTHRNRLTRSWPMMASVLLALPSAPVLAQQGALTLEEIIVTARRREESLQEVPISVTVFNQEQLDARNIFNTSDIATYTPSLSANNRWGADQPSFAIRGFT